jgi:NADPH:quinone reductase
MTAQHRLLNRVSELVDSGAIRPTLDHDLEQINATNLKTAHALIESAVRTAKWS